jgi:hypothetical protein
MADRSGTQNVGHIAEFSCNLGALCPQLSAAFFHAVRGRRTRCKSMPLSGRFWTKGRPACAPAWRWLTNLVSNFAAIISLGCFPPMPGGAVRETYRGLVLEAAQRTGELEAIGARIFERITNLELELAARLQQA